MTKYTGYKVEEMYKNASDLSQLFADSPAPRRISDAVRSKIEKFKVRDIVNVRVFILTGGCCRFTCSCWRPSATPGCGSATGSSWGRSSASR